MCNGKVGSENFEKISGVTNRVQGNTNIFPSAASVDVNRQSDIMSAGSGSESAKPKSTTVEKKS
jgi:hypothetical protein